MKNSRLAWTVTASGLFLLLALYCAGKFFYGQPAEEAVQGPAGKDAAAEDGNSILDAPRRMPVDEEQKTEFRSMFDSLAEAFSNGQHDVIAKWEGALPQMVESIPDRDFAQVAAGLYGALVDELSGKCVSSRSFANIQEFSARAKTDLAATRLYGKVCWRRRTGGDISSRLEALALKRLRDYKEMFETEGLLEFARIADAFIVDWTEQIESQDGFSRALAVYWMEHAKRWRRDANGNQQSWEHLRDKAIKQGSKWLVRVGYTPKWMDELMGMPDDQQRRGETTVPEPALPHHT